MDKFFDESREQSQVKAALVSKYFRAWANVIIPTAKRKGGKIAYIDLFAGPGRYKDGTLSTPLLVLEKAIADPNMREMLVTVFNDKNSDHSKTLESEIAKLPDINRLKYRPVVSNNEIGEEIVAKFEGMKLIPTLFFVDPWGYKGLSLRLINSVLRNWGCDCIFFFNYNRINMGINNQFVKKHMDAIFGEEDGENLRELLAGMSPEDREFAIVEHLAMALKRMGGKFVLPFCFKREDGSRTTHHLIFVSKDVTGYKIMKDIMAKESSEEDQGVPSFMYNPAPSTQQLLFSLSRPLDTLADSLCTDFSGQTLKMADVYNFHHIDKPFVKRNYKDVLRSLEASGRISAIPSVDKRRKRNGVVTFGDDVIVKFL